ncbi:hypothetical protein ACP4OV_027107 [Aristida adscensionis]
MACDQVASASGSKPRKSRYKKSKAAVALAGTKLKVAITETKVLG